ncbi:MAG: 2-methylcitrate dehydratase PrpD [Yoonia sp.]|jgi:2-methylcitrate dehydratase PrpD
MAPHFAQFAADLRPQELPPEVLTVLRRSLLDTVGVAAIGRTTNMAAIARKVAPIMGGAGATSARILMDGTQVSSTAAAMAGAMTVDSVDAHDGTSPCKGHAGSAIFPALFAFADGHNITGADFATLLAVGYEVAYRAGLAQHATCADYHTSGAWTAIGVATAYAKGLGCNMNIIRQAAGIAEYHGPRSQMMRCIDHPTMVRDGVGWGAPSGVTAAYLAQAGFTGAPALTCEQTPEFWEDLGTNWRLVSDTHYKPYPCCRWAHPAIDAALELMLDHGLHHSEVVGVDIKTFHNATRLAGRTPQTPDEFAYAIAFPVATMIVRGQIGVTELDTATLQDPDILRISRKTQLIDDPHLTKISDGKRWAAVSIKTHDGRQFDAPARTPRGDTDLPLSDAAIAQKFHLFADPVLGQSRANEIEALAGEFDALNAADFTRLIDLCLSHP